jgi:hypothetical protein
MIGHLKHSGHSSVLVMEPTQNRNRGNAITRLTWQNRGSFSFGNLLVDPLMGPCPIEIRNIGMQDTMQQLFIEDQHVVQAFSSHTAQETFTDGIGAFRVIRRFENLDATCCCHASETRAKLAIIISNEVLRRVSIRSGLPQRYAQSRRR